jgi:hypothetical protein
MATEAQEQEPVYTIEIPVAKAGRSFSLDLSKLPKEVYAEIVIKGAQSVMGRGMTEIKTQGLEGEELEKAREAAGEVAERNLQAMYDGKITLRAAKRVKTKGKEKTRAMQKARAIVKAQIKAEGLRISDYSAKEISLCAEQVLEDNPDMIEEARAELEREAKETTEKGRIKFSLKDTLKADPKRVKANEERKVKARAKTGAAPKLRTRGESRVQ